jgi:NAD(P)H dehydrogenase (quinone)
MKVHIVFVHEQRKSFNGALLDVAVKALKDAGHEVTVSDLYAMKFNPVLSQADIRGKLRP